MLCSLRLTCRLSEQPTSENYLVIPSPWQGRPQKRVLDGPYRRCQIWLTGQAFRPASATNRKGQVSTRDFNAVCWGDAVARNLVSQALCFPGNGTKAWLNLFAGKFPVSVPDGWRQTVRCPGWWRSVVSLWYPGNIFHRWFGWGKACVLLDCCLTGAGKDGDAVVEDNASRVCWNRHLSVCLRLSISESAEPLFICMHYLYRLS